MLFDQWLAAHSRYQSRHSAFATDADVRTFIPQRICFTATSILINLRQWQFSYARNRGESTHFLPFPVTGISGHSSTTLGT
jgi:hypothetical protein